MKTWLITGCSSGIGAGIAKAVLAGGDQAVVTARNTDAVKEIVDAYPDTALAVRLDVTKDEDIKNAVRAAAERFGNIDVLVNNAGYGYRSSVEEGQSSGVMQMYSTNLFGPIELIKEVLPQMRERKSGAIVNVSSIAAVRSAVGSAYYASSKAALELMTDGLARELEPLGIKVMIVEPGAFRTHFYDSSLKGTDVRITDYDATAGTKRVENVVNKKNQPGDPDKAGAVIKETIEKDEYPRCLLLGSDAVRIVTAAYEDKLREIEVWKDVSIRTDY